MRRKANLIAGAVCGALCVSSVLAYGAEVQNSFEKERAEVLERYGGEQVEVCVATEDIEVGDVFGKRQYREASLAGGAASRGCCV